MADLLDAPAVDPCPRCAGEAALSDGGKGLIFWAYCTGCGLKGAPERCAVDAADAWNNAAVVPKAPRQGEPGVADPTDSPAPREWRCFHCDEVFTDRIEARVHFGYDESKTAACLLKGAEGGLIAALRDAEAQADEAIQLMHSESSEAAKAYHRARCRYTQALIEAEQLGYDRGLADGRALGPST